MNLFEAYDPKDRENLWNRARAMVEEKGLPLHKTLHLAAKEAGFPNYCRACYYWKDQLNALISERLAHDQANDDRGDQDPVADDQEDDIAIPY